MLVARHLLLERRRRSNRRVYLALDHLRQLSSSTTGGWISSHTPSKHRSGSAHSFTRSARSGLALKRRDEDLILPPSLIHERRRRRAQRSRSRCRTRASWLRFARDRVRVRFGDQVRGSYTQISPDSSGRTATRRPGILGDDAATATSSTATKRLVGSRKTGSFVFRTGKPVTSTSVSPSISQGKSRKFGSSTGRSRSSARPQTSPATLRESSASTWVSTPSSPPPTA